MQTASTLIRYDECIYWYVYWKLPLFLFPEKFLTVTRSYVEIITKLKEHKAEELTYISITPSVLWAERGFKFPALYFCVQLLRAPCLFARIQTFS